MTYASESLRRAIRSGAYDASLRAWRAAVIEVYRLEREAEGQAHTLATYDQAGKLCDVPKVVRPQSD